VKKAFWKSKAFYGCVSTIVLVVGDMAANGVTAGNMMALVAAGFALYGRIVATAPLGMSDIAAASETDVEQAKADVRKSKVSVDADHGN
jgi:uncharacterized protein (UPF0264 family)